MNERNLQRCLIVVSFLFAALTDTTEAQNKKKPAPAVAVAVAGPTSIRVDGNIIKSYIEYMSAPEKEGRKSLTPGYEKTAEWAAGKFKEWGLQPAGDNGTFLQNVPITGPRSTFAWTTGVPELSLEGRVFYLKDNDFSIDTASTPGIQASAEIVFVGYGISAPSKGLDEYAHLEVKDKILLAFKGSPKDSPAARRMFGPAAAGPKEIEAWTEESRDAAKIKTAYEKGAAAILLFSPDKLAIPNPFGPPTAPTPTMPAFGGERSTVEGSPYTRPFLVISDVNERIFRQVMWRDPQESARGFLGRMDQIRRDIRDKKICSQATGVTAKIQGYATTVFYGEKFKNNISHNVIGKVEGTDPKLKTQFIVIGGHLDHLGMTNNVVFNGADDDASGASLTMEMARLIAANAAVIKPKRTILFALWCGEEMGLLGSNYFVKTPSDGVKIENVVANFNVDMVGLGERIGVPGALNFPAIYDVIMKNQEVDIAKLVDASTAGPGGSDYAAFIEQGIEALAFMTSGGVGHPDYHDAGDKIGKIDAEILRKTGQFVLQGVINVANETATDLIIADRLHLYNGMRLTPLNLAEARSGGRRSRGGMQSAPPGPRLNIGLSDVAAFTGNVALIDMAAKMLNVGRVDVPSRGDGQWFEADRLTENGRTALKAFEANGVVLNLINPSASLLNDMLDAAKKSFIVSGMTAVPDAAAAKRINEKNVLVAVDWDPMGAQAVAARLIELKKAIGDADNLLLVTSQAGPSRMGETEQPNPVAQRKTDEAKQQMYLALIKDGWKKDEIYATVGVSPSRADSPMSSFGSGRLGGNLAKLAP